ncbi:MAG: hypothetical protein MHMPM18_001864 [Marteilia pararefringens]
MHSNVPSGCYVFVNKADCQILSQNKFGNNSPNISELVANTLRSALLYILLTEAAPACFSKDLWQDYNKTTRKRKMHPFDKPPNTHRVCKSTFCDIFANITKIHSNNFHEQYKSEQSIHPKSSLSSAARSLA